MNHKYSKIVYGMLLSIFFIVGLFLVYISNDITEPYIKMGLLSIGTSFYVTVVITLIYRYILLKDSEGRMVQLFKNIIIQKDGVLGGCKKLGILEILPDRSYIHNNIINLIENAQKRVWMAGIGLRGFSD